jgi:zinc transport system ATP-binding protein
MIQIEAIDLSKSYGKVQVLDKLNITFSNDCPNFIVGPNGSGKSTLLKCIMKIIKYQGRIKGNDVAISYMPEQLPYRITYELIIS